MRFEVLLNGKRMCVAGLDGQLDIDVISSWPQGSAITDELRRLLRQSALTMARFGVSESLTDGPALIVSGVEKPGELDRIVWDWLETRLKTGDEVVIRVLGPGKVTPPTRRTPDKQGPDKNAASAYGVA